MSDGKSGKAPGNTVVKKTIKAYPIPMSFFAAEGAPAVKMSILKITTLGVIADPGEQFLNVGDQHQVSFQLPTQNISFKLTVKVIKTHDRFDINTDKKIKFVELHFKELSRDQKNTIIQFTDAIGQKRDQ